MEWAVLKGYWWDTGRTGAARSAITAADHLSNCKTCCLLGVYVWLFHLYGGRKACMYAWSESGCTYMQTTCLYRGLAHNGSNNKQHHRVQSMYKMSPFFQLKCSKWLWALSFSPILLWWYKLVHWGKPKNLAGVDCSCGDSYCITAVCQNLLFSLLRGHCTCSDHLLHNDHLSARQLESSHIATSSKQLAYD